MQDGKVIKFDDPSGSVIEGIYIQLYWDYAVSYYFGTKFKF